MAAQVVDSSTEAPVCWVCLDTVGTLISPCACPRQAHPHCLARCAGCLGCMGTCPPGTAVWDAMPLHPRDPRVLQRLSDTFSADYVRTHSPNCQPSILYAGGNCRTQEKSKLNACIAVLFCLACTPWAMCCQYSCETCFVFSSQ